MIRVTAEHNQRGERRSGDYCDVALAIRDVVRDGLSVAVSWSNVYIGEHCRLDLPPGAAALVYAVDSGRGGYPLDFPLAIPDHMLRRASCP